MRFYLTSLFLFISFWASAQTIQYYTKDKKPTADKAQASFYEEITIQSPTVGTVKYFKISGSLISEKQYSDIGNKKFIENEALLLDKAWFGAKKADGTFKTYYSTGALKRHDIFRKGELVKGSCFTKTGADTTYYDYYLHPEFPNGDKALMKYLRAELRYPDEARKDKIEGLVVVKFLVDKNGKIFNPEILKSLKPAFDQEVVRMVMAMPDWVPGKIDGVKRDIPFLLPVRWAY